MFWRTARLGSGLIVTVSLTFASAAVSNASPDQTTAGTPQAAVSAPRLPGTALAAGPAVRAQVPQVAGDDATLNGVTCTKASNCWVAGFYDASAESAVFGLAEHYDGRSWTTSMVSGMGGTNVDIWDAFAVSCGAPTNCMLVGEQYNGNTPAKVIQFADNLTTSGGWLPTAWANPPHTVLSLLDDVKCVGAAFCLAVGVDSPTAGVGRPLAERWDGAKWHLQSPLSPARSTNVVLDTVYCLSVSDCEAAGNYTNTAGRVVSFAESWNGAHWTLGPAIAVAGAPDTVLSGISCTAHGHCVGAGWDGTPSSSRPLIATLSGGRWHLPKTPTVAHAFLDSVSCPAATECLAVGEAGTRAFAEVWKGASWAITLPKQTTGTRPADLLDHVHCTSTTHCIAVGVQYNPKTAFSDHTLIEVWNGSTWRTQAGVNP
jgi:hypothetical protein